MKLTDEQSLVERAKSDMVAFGELYELHYTKMLNYVLRRTGDIEVAQDVTTEVFLKALSGLEKFQWRGAPFSAWLYSSLNATPQLPFFKTHR